MVMGGTDSSPGSFPYMAYLSLGNSHCGGVIINTLYILTAAHCVYARDKSRFKVYAGLHDLKIYNEYQQERSVSSVYIHESYNTNSTTEYDGDIAILKLNSPLNLNSRVGIIEYNLEPSTFTRGKATTVIGWGQPNNHTIISSILQCASIFIRTCDVRVTDALFCAGDNYEGHCKGDSGGPLISFVNGKNYVIGIVSRGYPCIPFFFHHPGISTNVSKFSRWISNVISSSGSKYNSDTCPSEHYFCHPIQKCIPSKQRCGCANRNGGGNKTIGLKWISNTRFCFV